VNNLSILFSAAISEPKVKWAVSQLISELLKDAEVMRAVEALVVEMAQKPSVLQATNELLASSSQAVLVHDEVFRLFHYFLKISFIFFKKQIPLSPYPYFFVEQVLAQSREFVADVMGDDRLQREGGNALINSVSHAVRPTLLRYLVARYSIF
jgi:hypothetical protein